MKWTWHQLAKGILATCLTLNSFSTAHVPYHWSAKLHHRMHSQPFRLVRFKSSDNNNLCITFIFNIQNRQQYWQQNIQFVTRTEMRSEQRMRRRKTGTNKETNKRYCDYVHPNRTERPSNKAPVISAWFIQQRRDVFFPISKCRTDNHQTILKYNSTSVA